MMSFDNQDNTKSEELKPASLNNKDSEEVKVIDNQEHEREELNSTIVPGKSRFPIKYSKKPEEPGTDSNAKEPSFEQPKGNTFKITFIVQSELSKLSFVAQKEEFEYKTQIDQQNKALEGTNNNSLVGRIIKQSETQTNENKPQVEEGKSPSEIQQVGSRFSFKDDEESEKTPQDEVKKSKKSKKEKKEKKDKKSKKTK